MGVQILLQRALLLTVVALGAGASAQTVVLRPSGQDTDTFRFNAAACVNDLQVTWTSSLIIAPCTALIIWSTQGECGDSPGSTDVRYPEVTPANVALLKTGSVTIKLAELPAFKYGDGGALCGTGGIERPHKVCASFGVSNATLACVPQHATSLNVIYDALAPVAPTIDSISEQDSSLQVKFTASSDTTVVHFDVRPAGSTDFSLDVSQIAVSTGTSHRIKSLTNGTTYDVRARAEDAAGNVGEPSEVFAATPRRTEGFFTNYRQSGGDEQGGCTAVHGLPLALAAGLWLLRRKRS